MISPMPKETPGHIDAGLRIPARVATMAAARG
jgi:hypothetical protein